MEGMVRRTKEEALATRASILDAAERLFQARGVSATSLHDIAQAAGVTRGAVYWHFKDKLDVFDAMLDRVVLPMHATAAGHLEGSGPALPRLRAHLSALFHWIESDAQAQRVFDIVTTRVEYVDELSALRERKQASCADYLQRLQTVLAQARDAGEIAADVEPAEGALGLYALVDGLIRHWVMAPPGFALRARGLLAVERHLAGLGARPADQPAPKVKPTRVTPP